MPKIFYAVIKTALGNVVVHICPECLDKHSSEVLPTVINLTGPVEGPKCDYCPSREEVI